MDYFLLLLTTCAPENGFAQDAIEYALLNRWVICPGEDFDADVRTIMVFYDDIIERYRAVHRRITSDLVASYSPLFVELGVAA